MRERSVLEGLGGLGWRWSLNSIKPIGRKIGGTTLDLGARKGPFLGPIMGGDTFYEQTSLTSLAEMLIALPY